MAAAGPREPARDFYQLLRVARDASREEITLAWRRRARDEHPGARQGDDGAPARVEGGSRQVPRAGAPDEEDLRLALLAELVLRYHGRGRPW